MENQNCKSISQPPSAMETRLSLLSKNISRKSTSSISPASGGWGVNFPNLKNKFTLLILITCSIFFFSCGPNYILDEKKEIANDQWTYSDSLSFIVDIPDTNRFYNLYLDIEHLTEYSFQNMYIRLHSIFPGGKRVTEQVSIELIGHGGRWNGDCNSDECDYRMSIHENAFFNQTGKHTFVIEQFMRKDPLEGIQSIAFRIEDTGKSRESEN